MSFLTSNQFNPTSFNKAHRGTGNGGVNYNTTSNARFKMYIGDYKNALDRVSKIKVRQYEMKSIPGKEQIRFFAQELQDIYPKAVSGSPDSDVDEEPIMIEYGRITPLLVKAIREQKELINGLQAEIEELKRKKTII